MDLFLDLLSMVAFCVLAPIGYWMVQSLRADKLVSTILAMSLFLAAGVFLVKHQQKKSEGILKSSDFEVGVVYQTISCFEDGNPLFAEALIRKVGENRSTAYLLKHGCPPERFAVLTDSARNRVVEPVDIDFSRTRQIDGVWYYPSRVTRLKAPRDTTITLGETAEVHYPSTR